MMQLERKSSIPSLSIIDTDSLKRVGTLVQEWEKTVTILQERAEQKNPELEEVANLCYQIFQHLREVQREKTFFPHQHIYLCQEHPDYPLGMLWSKEGLGTVEVLFLVVHPRVLHKGVGSALMHHIETVAAGKTIVLDPTVPARSFYGRLGYEEHYLSSGILRMRKCIPLC